MAALHLERPRPRAIRGTALRRAGKALSRFKPCQKRRSLSASQTSRAAKVRPTPLPKNCWAHVQDVQEERELEQIRAAMGK